MSSVALRFAWQRFVITSGRRWRGFVTIALIVGLTGGLAMAAIATARRTASSFDEAVRPIDSADLEVLTRVFDPPAGVNDGYEASVVARIAHLPYVERVGTVLGINAGPLTPDGLPLPASDGISPQGSLDGEFFSQDRIIVQHGRLSDPNSADELVLDAGTAAAYHARVGDKIPFGAFSNEQSLQPTGAGSPPQRPIRRFTLTLVGIAGAQPRAAVQDTTDAGNNALELFTPALTKQLLDCCVDDTQTALHLFGGSRHAQQVAAEIAPLVASGLPFYAVHLDTVRATAERALRPEVIAISVFGFIAALAALAVSGQLIGRTIRLDAQDLPVLRALGADPITARCAFLVGMAFSITVGALLAALTSVLLSPIAPIGPFRRFVSTAMHPDWTVIVAGCGVLLVCLGAVALGVTYVNVPRRGERREPTRPPRRSSAARVAAASGLPLTATTGIRFALEPGSGGNSVPVRSAISAAVLSFVILVTTLVFGTSLRTLVNHPPLYGWNWDLEMNGGGGLGDIPARPAAKLLDADPDVAAWSGYYFSTLLIDGITVPVLGGDAAAAVTPAILDGQAMQSGSEIVLGASTLARLHRRIGDEVSVAANGTKPVNLRIVGTATLPAVGTAGASHLEMGSGAVVPYQVIPAADRNVFAAPDPGPNAIFVRLRRGVSLAAGAASLKAIVTTLSGMPAGDGTVLTVQRPAEIINYHALGTTPAVLGAWLAAGALAGLALTLVATVRRRRHEFAVMKALGCTPRQLAAIVAWQAGVAVGIGLCIGVPVGIATGRTSWNAFAGGIHAVPRTSVPVGTLTLVAVSAVLLAVLVAAIPGTVAARTRTSQLLRAE